MSAERLVIESMLRVPSKDAQDVDFLLNQDQAAFDAGRCGRDIIAKYRQGGFSTYPLGRALVDCMGHRNRRHTIIAHNTDTTQKLLARMKYMIKHIKGPQPDLEYATQTRLVFRKTDSSVHIGTAGSDDFGVGDTITDLHCSEVSRWANPDALLNGLFQAVPPSGNILIESTGHGQGNWFHRAVMRALNGNGRYKLHFFSWLRTPEYSVAMSEDDAGRFMDHLDETLDEPRYAALGLTAGQLAWRRLQLADLNYDTRLFQENYPVSLAECFQATGHSVFPEVNFQPVESWRPVSPWLTVLGEHPMPGVGYVVGADPSGGVGKDYSVVEVLSEDGEQVAEYRNNMIQPDKFGPIVVALAKQFNNAYVNPERNNHGILVVQKILESNYPERLLHQARFNSRTRAPNNRVAELADFGTYTTNVVKNLMIGSLQEGLPKEMIIHSATLNMELGSFVEKAEGRMEAEEGCFDDTVMALALAEYVRPAAARMFERARRRAASERNLRTVDLFEASRVLGELEQRYQAPNGDGLPISSGLNWEAGDANTGNFPNW